MKCLEIAKQANIFKKTKSNSLLKEMTIYNPSFHIDLLATKDIILLLWIGRTYYSTIHIHMFKVPNIEFKKWIQSFPSNKVIARIKLIYFFITFNFFYFKCLVVIHNYYYNSCVPCMKTDLLLEKKWNSWTKSWINLHIL